MIVMEQTITPRMAVFQVGLSKSLSRMSVDQWWSIAETGILSDHESEDVGAPTKAEIGEEEDQEEPAMIKERSSKRDREMDSDDDDTASKRVCIS